MSNQIKRKHIVVNENLYNEFLNYNGKNHSTKLANLLLDTKKRQATDYAVNKVINAHMNEVKKILDRQTNIIDDFMRRAKPLIDYIDKSTSY